MLEEAAKADDQGKLLNVMETVRLCCRLFFSLNWQVRDIHFIIYLFMCVCVYINIHLSSCST